MTARIRRTIWDETKEKFVWIYVEIVISEEIIARQLAGRAFKNASKTASAIFGGVKVRVVDP